MSLCSPHPLVIAHHGTKLIATRPDARRVARLPKLSDRTSGVLLHPTSLPGGPGGRPTGRARRARSSTSWPRRARAGGRCSRSARPATRIRLTARSRRSPATRRWSRSTGWSTTACSRRQIAASATRKRCARRSRRSGTAAAAIATSRRSRPRARAWLEDFALYRAIKRAHGETQWTLWPAPLRDRDPRALAGARKTFADEIAFVRFVQWRFARDWQALRDHAHARGVGADRRHPDLHGARQRRRLEEARPLSSGPIGRGGADRRRAARLLQRDRPALGQPALPLGPHAADGICLVDCALPRHPRSLRRRPPRPLHRLHPLLGDPGERADGDQRTLAARPGRALLQGGAARAARGSPAAHRRGPGRGHARGQGAARRLRAPRHQDPAVRVRHRSERARLPAPQLPAQRRRLHGHARQRHDRRLVSRSGQRNAQRRNRPRRNGGPRSPTSATTRRRRSSGRRARSTGR